MGPQTNRVNNGILLRADLHLLFDLQLIAIDTATWTVVVAPALQATCYGYLHGSAFRRPVLDEERPLPQALDEHRAKAKL